MIFADEGATQVLSIHIAAALSAIVNVARVAAQETTSTQVTVFDSQQLSLGTGFLVETAAKLGSGRLFHRRNPDCAQRADQTLARFRRA